MACLRKKGKKKWQIILELGTDLLSGKWKRETKIVNTFKNKAKEIMHKFIN